MLEKLDASQINLPNHIDILIHLLKDSEDNNVNCSGIVLQYNLAAIGPTPEIALEKAVRLATDHYTRCREMGMDPYRMADLPYLAAFVLGRPLPQVYEGVRAHMSLELARYLGSPTIDVRSICDLQQTNNLFDVDLLVKHYQRPFAVA